MIKAHQGKITVAILLFSALFLLIGNRFAASHALPITVTDYESELSDQIFAKVTKIDSVSPNPSDSTVKIVKFTCVVTRGKETGKTVRATQYSYLKNSAMPQQVQVNDRVVLGMLSSGGSAEYTFENYDRIGQIFLLGLALIFLLVVFGGKNGIKTVFSLALTCLVIFLVFVPSILAGFNIYFATVIVCAFIILVSYGLTGGINSKSLAAAIGCSGGVAVSGLLYIFMERIMKLTGYYNDQTSLIKQSFVQCPLDLKALVFAMVTVGALGATMDVGMSIASSLDEIQAGDKDFSRYDLIRAGLNIGKDITGTMTNTLILAYIGSSLVMVLIYAAAHYPLLQLMNQEEIIVEILQSLIGSFGILFTIPITTVTSACLARKRPLPVQRAAGLKPHAPQGGNPGKRNQSISRPDDRFNR